MSPKRRPAQSFDSNVFSTRGIGIQLRHMTLVAEVALHVECFGLGALGDDHVTVCHLGCALCLVRVRPMAFQAGVGLEGYLILVDLVRNQRRLQFPVALEAAIVGDLAASIDLLGKGVQRIVSAKGDDVGVPRRCSRSCR